MLEGKIEGVFTKDNKRYRYVKLKRKKLPAEENIVQEVRFKEKLAKFFFRSKKVTP